MPNNLKILRIKRGLTTGQLSAYTSIDRTTLSRLENEVRPFTQDHIKILSKFFNVSTDYLLGLSDTPNPKEDNDIQLDDFQFALYGEVKDLTEEQKQTLLNMAKFLKDSNNGK